MKANTEDRFDQLFTRARGCWIWTGAINDKGYGTFRLNGRRHLAHRFSFFRANPTADRALCVCHQCDNPKCVNPDHLFLGTHLDNFADMRSKGRNSCGRGTRQWNAKLSPSRVRRARLLYRSGRFSYRQLAEKFGVRKSTIHKAVTGFWWNHVE